MKRLLKAACLSQEETILRAIDAEQKRFNKELMGELIEVEGFEYNLYEIKGEKGMNIVIPMFGLLNLDG